MRNNAAVRDDWNNSAWLRLKCPGERRGSLEEIQIRERVFDALDSNARWVLQNGLAAKHEFRRRIAVECPPLVQVIRAR